MNKVIIEPIVEDDGKVNFYSIIYKTDYYRYSVEEDKIYDKNLKEIPKILEMEISDEIKKVR